MNSICFATLRNETLATRSDFLSYVIKLISQQFYWWSPGKVMIVVDRSSVWRYSIGRSVAYFNRSRHAKISSVAQCTAVSLSLFASVDSVFLGVA